MFVHRLDISLTRYYKNQQSGSTWNFGLGGYIATLGQQFFVDYDESMKQRGSKLL